MSAAKVRHIIFSCKHFSALYAVRWNKVLALRKILDSFIMKRYLCTVFSDFMTWTKELKML